jgi:hypothetical protein
MYLYFPDTPRVGLEEQAVVGTEMCEHFKERLIIYGVLLNSCGTFVHTSQL